MSTWRCGSICPRSYLFAAVFLAGVSPSVSSRPERRAFHPGLELGKQVRQILGFVELLRLLLGGKWFSAFEFRLDQLV
jgi:hypothetical protein